MRPASKLLLVLLSLATAARAEEGMWTFDAFPSAKVKSAYGFEPDGKWLDHVRLSSVRLANGCSASFVASTGLVMTNHHCVRSCVEQLSTAKADYLANGFFAAKPSDEKRCTELEANELVEIRDVSDRIHGATAKLDGAAYNAALKKEMTAIESECGSDPHVRCDVISLFQGARYALYKYRRWQDVRLVFAPEFPMAAFGGYPDNFNFPRYGLDSAFIRVYEDGKPITSPDFFRWSQAGAKENDLVFTSGHPGGTDRKLSVADLEFARDVELPWSLLLYSEYRGALRELLRQKPQLEREVAAQLRSIENAHKALLGRHLALGEPSFFQTRRQEEQTLREKIRRDFQDWKTSDGAFDQVAKAEDTYRTFYAEHRLLEAGDAFQSDLYRLARTLVRAAVERPKPNAERLREFTDAAWTSEQQRLLADRPISKDLDEALFVYSLEKLREKLGADHPTAQAILGKEIPRELAAKLVRGTKLGDAKFRKQLLDGGAAAVNASTDPMIVFARKVDPFARAVRIRYETQVEGALKQGRERIAKAKIDAEGTTTYPDATFTLRLSYGQVKGWKNGDAEVAPFTTFGGAIARAFGKPPFALPKSWLQHASKVPPETHLDVSTSNDIIGGNSGSPLIDRNAEIVGLIFDGNLPSLGGRYYYDPETNRATAVDARGLQAALREIYGAGKLADELGH